MHSYLGYLLPGFRVGTYDEGNGLPAAVANGLSLTLGV
jgi:hypothetical protein